LGRAASTEWAGMFADLSLIFMRFRLLFFAFFSGDALA
jgi:hypothetical protein